MVTECLRTQRRIECDVQLSNYTKKFLYVRDLMPLFKVEWQYKCVMRFECDNKKDIDCYDLENAIWASHVQRGILLDKNVTWGHMYLCTEGHQEV